MWRSSLVIAAVGVVALLAVGVATRLPWRLRVIMSDSMQPTLARGDMIVTRRFDGQGDDGFLVVGEIIVFSSRQNGSAAIAHRLVSSEQQGTWLITKGDNETVSDGRIQRQAVKEVVVASIPAVGKFAHSAQSPLGLAVFVVLPAALVIGNEIRRLALPRQVAGRQSCHYSARPLAKR